MNRKRLLFLSLGCAWPPYRGAYLRTMGLLSQLCLAFDVEFLALVRCPISPDQHQNLTRFATRVTTAQLRDQTASDRLGILSSMLRHTSPYHCAAIEFSLRKHPSVLSKIQNFEGSVFTDTGHWGTLTRSQEHHNWILNQCDADIDFWRVYASQSDRFFTRIAASVNYRLAEAHFPQIYSRVGCVISVCEEDRQLTLSRNPNARVEVIENGVDCDYFHPGNRVPKELVRLLFTGTSARRNVVALRRFLADVFPLIRERVSSVELLVAGDFSKEAQTEFSQVPSLRFTGRIDDIRPAFNESDIFIAPFAETHGSKLKIAQAMAMSLPIVASPEGVRGFPLEDGLSVLIAKSELEFAQHVLMLAGSPQMRLSLGAAARAIAKKRLDWTVLGTKLRTIVQSTLNDPKVDISAFQETS